MCSDENHFSVSLIVRGKVTKTVFIKHNFWRERRAKAKRNQGNSVYQPNALPQLQYNAGNSNSYYEYFYNYNTIREIQTPIINIFYNYNIIRWIQTPIINIFYNYNIIRWIQTPIMNIFYNYNKIWWIQTPIMNICYNYNTIRGIQTPIMNIFYNYNTIQGIQTPIMNIFTTTIQFGKFKPLL